VLLELAAEELTQTALMAQGPLSRECLCWQVELTLWRCYCLPDEQKEVLAEDSEHMCFHHSDPAGILPVSSRWPGLVRQEEVASWPGSGH